MSPPGKESQRERLLTPAMVRAGAKALQEWYESDLWWDEAVIKIYKAMTSAGEIADATQDNTQIGGESAQRL
jgi:hypothetical protein